MSASSTGTIKVALQIDDKGIVKVLKSVGDESERTGRKGKKAFDKMDKSGKGFTGTAKKISSAMLKIGGAAGIAAIAAVVGLAVALKKLANVAKEYVGLAGVQEEAETDLQAVLIATGHAAGFNLEQLKAMASGMQKLTTVGDETILGGMAILATFKRIRHEAFERSTRAALDMAQVLKKDLNSSMIMIGKAVNDPIKGLKALGLSGVTFTEGQKDMIKTLQESGNIIAAQNIILTELESEFGGAAEAAAGPFKGGMDQASNALGDVKEEMGFLITKNKFFIELTHLATEEFERWGEYINSNREDLMLLATDGFMTLVDAIRVGVEVMRFFHNGWLGIKLVAHGAIWAIATVLDTVYPVLRNFMKPVDLLFDGLVKLGQIDVNPFDSMEQGLGDFRASAKEGVQKIWTDIEEANQGWDRMGSAIDKVKEKLLTLGTGKAEPVEIKAKVIVNTDDAAKDINHFKNNAETSLRNIGIDNALSGFFDDIDQAMAEDMKNNLAELRDGVNGLYSDLNDKPLWAQFKDGGIQALDSIKQRMMSTSDMVASGITQLVDGVGDAIGQWASGAKSFKEAFKDMARSVVSSLVSMIAKQLLYNAISSMTNSGGGGGSGAVVSTVGSAVSSAIVQHNGGVGPSEGQTRIVPNYIFAGAPKLHTGLLPGEYAAVLKKDEGVFTPKQMAALGKNNKTTTEQAPPAINVKNINVMDPAVVGDYLDTDDGEQKIINVMQRNKGAFA